MYNKLIKIYLYIYIFIYLYIYIFIYLYIYILAQIIVVILVQQKMVLQRCKYISYKLKSINPNNLYFIPFVTGIFICFIFPEYIKASPCSK